MRAFIDYLRVAVACLSFVLIDPTIEKLTTWLPDGMKWAQGLASVAASAGISWIIFKVVNPLSSIDFEWGDKLSGTMAKGPVLDISPRTGEPGQVFAVSMTRSTNTWLAHRAIHALMKRGLCILIESNQSELQMELWSVAPLVQSHRDALVISFGKPDHDTHTIPFELGLLWAEVPASEFSAKLRYTPTCEGPVMSWIARRLVRLNPTVVEVRKVGGSV
ncbi:hypothetical protein FHX49_000020 [Microbacterium endophyticum]|uniref:Uncharacterized protein n=1 Tax=Microbacterium endophyticum TaxID=1526412 RepID=A0A7W4V0W7_9MICO|nr:hypothetical protein [Microbacterium endophyticum]MBB2974479.1 hypothetical protein [Microbacterium endophyticum]NIK36776.1 hypothetical protein [Microbacterium endophyticum]